MKINVFLFHAQFKQDISEDIAKMVARKTVKEVLSGLEGAVITSVRGGAGASAGLAPLQEMFAAAASTMVPEGAQADGQAKERRFSSMEQKLS